MRKTTIGVWLALLSAACDLDAPPPRYPDQNQQAQQTPNDTPAPTTAPLQGYASDEIVIGADTNVEYIDTDPSALSDFHASLDPYGAWLEDPSYGTVWVPAATVVGPDFVPYVSRGRWVYEDDYLWVSDYDWGWAPFHFGRWAHINGVGWAWIPGRTYRGAWVVWRTGAAGYGYVGWAPAPPMWIWRGGVAVGIGFVPQMPYAFCARGDVFAPSVATKVVRGSQVAVIANNTRPWTPAAPTVGDRTPARPTVGPPPGKLGLDLTALPHAPPNDPGLQRAAQASRPIPRPIAPPLNPQLNPQAPSYLIPQVLPSQPSPTPTPPITQPPVSPPSSPSPPPFIPAPIVNPQPPILHPTPQPFPTPAPRPPVVSPPTPIPRPAPPPPPVSPPPTFRPPPPPPPPGARPPSMRR